MPIIFGWPMGLLESSWEALSNDIQYSKFIEQKVLEQNSVISMGSSWKKWMKHEKVLIPHEKSINVAIIISNSQKASKN